MSRPSEHPMGARARHERAKIASLTRSRTPDDPALVAARRDLKAARLEDYIRRVVDTAPPLTVEQRDKLATLLRGIDAPDMAASPIPDAPQRQRGGDRK